MQSDTQENIETEEPEAEHKQNQILRRWPRGECERGKFDASKKWSITIDSPTTFDMMMLEKSLIQNKRRTKSEDQ